jgi:hypothetical protein
MHHVNNMLYAIRLVDILNSHTDYILCQQQRWIYFFPYPILLSLLLGCKFVFGISLAFEKQLQFSLAQGSPCLLAKLDMEANRNKHKQMIFMCPNPSNYHQCQNSSPKQIIKNKAIHSVKR